jgi:hypothetical protein
VQMSEKQKLVLSYWRSCAATVQQRNRPAHYKFSLPTSYF